MTTYPLPTLAATVSATGISSPSYADILASLKASATLIFGAGTYLEADSQDGQLLAVFAQAISDANATAVAVYNSFSPVTAQGAGLSSNVKINGLRRLIPSNSTVTVTIVGVAGTLITNGLVSDTNGNQWALPSTVTIPVGGSINVTATAVTAGAIAAAASTVTIITTPTLGWQTVTNAAAATAGSPVETDATLRQRQAVSTSLPAQTPLQAIYGAVANVTGVTQLKAYENDTGTTDSNGLPPHSISLVVKGGTISAIASAIASKKNPGTSTYGTTSLVVTDPLGIPNTINFYQPTTDTIDVNITLKALTGYVSTTGTLIQSQLAAYINSLGIGGTSGKLYNSKLYAPADDTGSLAGTYNVTVLQTQKNGGGFTASDQTIAFNELPVSGTITVTVV